MEKLNATTLKNTLWETLNRIKDGDVSAADGDAIASQAREILRTIKTQVVIIERSKTDMTNELKEFAIPRE